MISLECWPDKPNSFIDAFDTLEQSKATYPEAEPTHPHLMPLNTFDHLPDEQDLY